MLEDLHVKFRGVPSPDHCSDVLVGAAGERGWLGWEERGLMWAPGDPASRGLPSACDISAGHTRGTEKANHLPRLHSKEAGGRLPHSLSARAPSASPFLGVCSRHRPSGSGTPGSSLAGATRGVPRGCLGLRDGTCSSQSGLQRAPQSPAGGAGEGAGQGRGRDARAAHHRNCFRKMLRFRLFLESRKVIWKTPPPWCWCPGSSRGPWLSPSPAPPPWAPSWPGLPLAPWAWPRGSRRAARCWRSPAPRPRPPGCSARPTWNCALRTRGPRSGSRSPTQRLDGRRGRGGEEPGGPPTPRHPAAPWLSHRMHADAYVPVTRLAGGPGLDLLWTLAPRGLGAVGLWHRSHPWACKGARGKRGPSQVTCDPFPPRPAPPCPDLPGAESGAEIKWPWPTLGGGGAGETRGPRCEHTYYQSVSQASRARHPPARAGSHSPSLGGPHLAPRQSRAGAHLAPHWTAASAS